MPIMGETISLSSQSKTTEKKKTNATSKLQYGRHPKEPSCKEAYNNSVTKEYDLNENTKLMWVMLKETLVTSANDIIVKKSREDKSEWLTIEILEMMKKRQHCHEMAKNTGHYMKQIWTG